MGPSGKKDDMKEKGLSAEELFKTGQKYFKGNGVEKNDAEAMRWFEKAAEMGHGQAQFNLGRCLCEGEGVEHDYYKAREWLLKARDQGYNTLAQGYIDTCDKEIAAVEYEQKQEKRREEKLRAAESGSPEAQFKLGCYYAHRDTGFDSPFPEDMDKAAYWFERAAEQGHVEAMLYRGNIAEWPVKDLPTAVKWYEKAARKGNDSAMYCLGRLYKKDWKDHLDEKAAFSWFRKAAEQGSTYGMYELGDCYRKGIGTGQDFDRAEYWLKKCYESDERNYEAYSALHKLPKEREEAARKKKEEEEKKREEEARWQAETEWERRDISVELTGIAVAVLVLLLSLLFLKLGAGNHDNATLRIHWLLDSILAFASCIGIILGSAVGLACFFLSILGEAMAIVGGIAGGIGGLVAATTMGKYPGIRTGIFVIPVIIIVILLIRIVMKRR